jgi:Zn finger protein HypA/HybF involved in hydrogenase expression
LTLFASSGEACGGGSTYWGFMQKISEMVAVQEKIVRDQEQLILKTKAALEYIVRMSRLRRSGAEQSLMVALSETHKMAKKTWEEIRRYEMEMNDEENMYCEGCSNYFRGKLEDCYCPKCKSTEIFEVLEE